MLADLFQSPITAPQRGRCHEGCIPVKKSLFFLHQGFGNNPNTTTLNSTLDQSTSNEIVNRLVTMSCLKELLLSHPAPHDKLLDTRGGSRLAQEPKSLSCPGVHSQDGPHPWVDLHQRLCISSQRLLYSLSDGDSTQSTNAEGWIG